MTILDDVKRFGEQTAEQGALAAVVAQLADVAMRLDYDTLTPSERVSLEADRARLSAEYQQMQGQGGSDD